MINTKWARHEKEFIPWRMNGHPILPCRELDESISFYETLGFKRTYRQVRPNPYAVVALEDIQIHLAGIDGFNPADSYDRGA